MKVAHFIKGDNFTDMYKELQEDLLYTGEIISPRGMKTYELLNCNLILTDPRDRLLYSNVRKHNYTYGSAEFLWYMSGSNLLEPVEFYLPRMREFSDDGKTLNSAYGYRIFGKQTNIPNQWLNAYNKLITDVDTRQAVITVHYWKDINTRSKDVPCTMNLHFMIRDNELILLVQMRSNDAYMGLVYDVFSFTLMQEHMFNQLRLVDQYKDLKLGPYIHRSDSMHLYARDAYKVDDLLEEKPPLNVMLSLEDRIFYSDELPALIKEEKDLRKWGYEIGVDQYQGINRFIAIKLNKILEKKKRGRNS